MNWAIFVLLLATDRQEAASTPPIVFLPGTGGSALRFHETDKLYWISPKILRPGLLARGDASRQPDSLYASEVLSSVGLTEIEQLKKQLKQIARDSLLLPDQLLNKIPDSFPIYAKFLKWAGEEFGKTGFYAAPYDWRLRPAASLEQIDAVVERARSEHQCSQVILLCHSLGGLVGREYIATTGKGKVARLIAIGTPWLGTPQAARALLRGNDFGIGVTVPNRLPGKLNEIVPEIHVPVRDIVFGHLTRHSPTRIAFVPSRATQQLARSFPSLFLMSPAVESGTHLESLLGSPANEKLGVVAEWTSDEFYRQMRQLNVHEFLWAQKWRAQYLSRQDYGVQHRVVGLVSSSSAPASEWQFVRFSALKRPETAVLPHKAPPAIDRFDERLDGVVDIFRPFMREARELERLVAEMPLKLRRRIYRELDQRTSLTIELDEFVPTHLNRLWGDGTVPLYSATAGAVESLGNVPAEAQARRMLGFGTTAHVSQLSAGKSHMSALDDPDIRALILRYCKPDATAEAQ
jgi:pimeloyl-ACP methyl ester carboxylesterase